MEEYKEYSMTVLRVLLGLLFLLPGISKLMTLIGTGTHAMLVGMMGLSAAVVWALAIVEVVCGIALLLGYQVKYAAWPLVVVILAAGFMTIDKANPMWQISLLFHLVTGAALAHVGLHGAGPLAVDK